MTQNFNHRCCCSHSLNVKCQNAENKVLESQMFRELRPLDPQFGFEILTIFEVSRFASTFNLSVFYISCSLLLKSLVFISFNFILALFDLLALHLYYMVFYFVKHLVTSLYCLPNQKFQIQLYSLSDHTRG